MAIRKPLMNALVRLIGSGPSQNNTVRVQRNGQPAITVTLDAGVYWLGVHGNSGTADSAIITDPAESLLDELEDAILGYAGGSWEFALDYSGSDAIGSPGDTGKIRWTADDIGDLIDWAHAGTTVSPEWFGVTKNAAAYPTTTWAGASWEELGTVASSMALVGDIGIWNDLLRVKHKRKVNEVDSGKKFAVYFGRKKGRRRLEFRASGVPREETDNTYHSLRRFVEHLNTTGQSFFYWPDSSLVPTAQAWDPDDSGGEIYRYGWQRLVPDVATLPFDWDDTDPYHAGYHQEWNKEFDADPYVAP